MGEVVAALGDGLLDRPRMRAEAEAAAGGFVLRNGVCAAGQPRALIEKRLWLHAAYRATAEEEREEIVSAAVSARTGEVVEGFEAAIELDRSRPLALDRETGRLAMIAALRRCQRAVEDDLSAFRASAARRLERDREPMEAYFRANRHRARAVVEARGEGRRRGR